MSLAARSNSPYIRSQGKQPESSALNERDKDGVQPVFAYFDSTVASATPFVNNETSLWVLVIGLVVGIAVTSGTAGANNAFLVTNAAGQNIDEISVVASAFGAPASGYGTPFQGLFKKLLIPPGGSLKTTQAAAQGFQALKGKFEDVIRFI